MRHGVLVAGLLLTLSLPMAVDRNLVVAPDPDAEITASLSVTADVEFVANVQVDAELVAPLAVDRNLTAAAGANADITAALGLDLGLTAAAGATAYGDQRCDGPEQRRQPDKNSDWCRVALVGIFAAVPQRSSCRYAKPAHERRCAGAAGGR